jgi:serine/threonine protein kinase/Tol biopolymer transport system component
MESSAMDAERWQNVERLYHATLECEESRRDAFLTRACGGDEALRRDVESLVSYGNRSAKFIEGSALEVLAPALAGEVALGQDAATDECRLIEKMIGKRISQYRVVEHLGSGGMGEVYRAARADDQFEKQVAIKLLHAGEASGFVIGRFKNERQILANLDHPNIARLLDGGATDEGVPYFVMELVEGQPIDKYCDSHKLGIPARLKIFLQVCSALQYAHQHQIIHRDIKPSNILVTAEGVPKLLDFGIAKILDSTVRAGEARTTQTSFRAFTPEYASPEQIKAEPIGTASDVYSLGVLLYELLTGHRPYRFETLTPAEIERAICEEEPLAPSSVVARVEEQTQPGGTTVSITPEEISEARDSDPKRMHSCLLGDLDAIVMMALRKEPHRRYVSVHDFSEDIRKHLEGLPIMARPSTIAYFGSKFIRRHTELAIGALIFLVLLGGRAVLRHWEMHKPVPGPKEEVVRTQLTANAPGNQVISAAISRDGRYLAYSDSAWKMHLLQIDSRKLRRLPSSDFAPVDWFPDGNHLLVYGRGQHSGLWTMSISDGTSRKLLDSLGFAVALSLDGSHIAYQKDSSAPEIWVMNANGEQPHRIAEFDATDTINSLAWSPSGRRLVYIRSRGDLHKAVLTIETCDLQGGQRTLVLSEPKLMTRSISDLRWLADGRILYRLPDPLSHFDFNFWAVATDPVSGRAASPSARLINGALEAQEFHASADGKRFTYLSLRSSDAVYLGNLKPGARTFNPRRLTLDQWNNWPTDWTRDSKALLFESSRSGRFAILKQRIDGQTPEVLLAGAESRLDPTFSSTGDRLLYTAAEVTGNLHDSSKRLMTVPVDAGAPSVLLEGGYTYHCGSVPAARCVLSEVQGQQLVFSILDPVEGKGPELQRVNAPHQSSAYWSLSPDGNKIAIADQAAFAGEVKILTLAESKVVTLPLKGWRWKTVQTVSWSADGGHLFATAYTGSSFVLLFIDLRGNLRVLTEVPEGEAWLYKPVASPDGRYLAYEKRTFESNVMMLENF